MSYSNLKELLKDERISAVAARVAVHDGEERHWYVNEEGDYVVTVVTLQHGIPIDANWHNPPGEYSLPDVNDEVLVGFDDGEFEGEAYIVCVTTSGNPVADGEAGELVPGQLIVVRDRVETRAATKILLKSLTVEAKNNGASQPTIRGTTYRSAEDTLLTALGTFATAIGALNPVTAPAAAAALNAAITSFQSAASTYLTTVLKGE